MRAIERLEENLIEVSRGANALLKALQRIKRYDEVEERKNEVYDEAKRITVQALRLIDSQQPYGIELFDALSKITTSIAVETVVLRTGKGAYGLEVLMTQRTKDDIAYPGEWHCPGRVLRPGEEFPDGPLKRLVKNELFAEIGEAKFVGYINHREEARGHFLLMVYLIENIGTSNKGEWFPVDQLPEPTVDCHREKVIPLAVSKYGMIPLWTRTSE